MAKRFIDFVRFESAAKPEFKSAIEDMIWKIDYWPIGRSLLQTMMQKMTGKIYDNQLDLRSCIGTAAIDNKGVVNVDPNYFATSDYFERH